MLFCYLDIFRHPIWFYYQGHSRISSKLGILFSLIIFSLLIYQFTISEFFAKRSPLVVTQSLKTSHASAINFDKNFPLLMTLTDPVSYLSIIDPTIYNLNIEYFNQNKFVKKEVHPCKIDDLHYNESYFNQLQMNKSFCLSDPNFSLEGFLDEYSFSYLQVSLYPCQNSSENNNSCKTQTEIESFFKGKIFFLGYESSQLDARDYLNPLKVICDPPTVYLDQFLTKTNVIYLENIEVLTDDHWLLPEYKMFVNKGIKSETNKLDYEIRNNFSQPLVRWSLVASKEKVVCTRKYQKLPEALASLSSMAQLQIIICGLVVNLFSYVSFLSSLMNKLYDFKKKEANNEKKERVSKYLVENKQRKESDFENQINLKVEECNKNKKLINFPQVIAKINFSPSLSITKSNTIMVNGKISPKEIKDESVNSEKSSIMNNETQKNTIFSLSVLEYFIFKVKQAFCFNQNEKQKTIEKAEKVFKKKMDIIYVQRQLQKIDFFKKIFLNKEQMTLFKGRKKPVFIIENGKHEKKLESIKDLEKYLNCRQIKCRESELDLKLIRNCDLNRIGVKQIRNEF